MLDGTVSGAEQAEPRARSGSQHEVTRQRRPVPAEQRDGVPLAQARTKLGQQRPHAARRRAGSGLHHGQLVDLVADTEPVACIDEQVGRVLTVPASATVADARRRGTRAHRAATDRRTSSSRRPRSADRARCPRRRGSSRAARDRSRGWLGRLKSWNSSRRIGNGAAPPSRSTRCPRGSAGSPSRSDDEDGLLEARVEPRQPGEVGAVLAVGVDRRGGRSAPSAMRSRRRSRRST